MMKPDPLATQIEYYGTEIERLMTERDEARAALTASQAREAGLRNALGYAISIIESYQLDIQDSQKLVGVDLAALGFCQGTIYREAIDDIREIQENAGIDAPKEAVRP